ncbi:hypothetical protein [Microbacterium sp. K24]|uniref:hypothetical protein n=1 Tax=Microbacterium sp. K24 TaxID=2305446 RepID=UPI00109C0F2F|nr:hypothetical protein [Microbacterium sp. K24]
MTTTTAPTSTANTTTAGTDESTAPRTRWAAIVWGLLFAAVAAGALWLLADDDRRSGIADWTTSLTPTMIGTIAILTVGVLLLVAGAAGLLRRAQRRMAAGTAPGTGADAVTE